MFKGKGYLGGILTLVVVALLIGFTWVNSVQGQANSKIAIVNSQAIFTQYLATPLFEARDELQAEYDAKIEDLSDEETAQLFMEYQTRLEKLEIEYSNKVETAIAQVAKENGYEIMVDSSVVLHGGIDVTEDVLAALK